MYTAVYGDCDTNVDDNHSYNEKLIDRTIDSISNQLTDDECNRIVILGDLIFIPWEATSSIKQNETLSIMLTKLEKLLSVCNVPIKHFISSNTSLSDVRSVICNVYNSCSAISFDNKLNRSAMLIENYSPKSSFIVCKAHNKEIVFVIGNREVDLIYLLYRVSCGISNEYRSKDEFHVDYDAFTFKSTYGYANMNVNDTFVNITLNAHQLNVIFTYISLTNVYYIDNDSIYIHNKSNTIVLQYKQCENHIKVDASTNEVVSRGVILRKSINKMFCGHNKNVACNKVYKLNSFRPFKSLQMNQIDYSKYESFPLHPCLKKTNNEVWVCE